MRIAVVGGGPAGLLFACLLREHRPDIEVALFERNPPDATYGFGVVFSASTLRRLSAHDERLGHELRSISTHWDRMELRVSGERRSCGGLDFAAVARRRLLDLLQARAQAAAVDLRFRTEAEVAALEADYDLVVGADGVSSAVRAAHEQQMGPEFELATAKYIWFGAAKAFQHMTFLFEQSEAGWFAVHAYPYGENLSTFVVECEPDTWRRAGFDAFDDSAPPTISDERTRLAMQELFAEHLDGAPLLANKSRWLSFRTLRVRRWSDGGAVILGDAAHTAHFSVGSGTTMALEDAVVLAERVAELAPGDSSSPMLVQYESDRRPSIARVQDAATPSRSWWERFAAYLGAFDIDKLCIHFLTRSGRISARRLAAGDPEFFAHVTGGDIEEIGERVWRQGPLGARSPLGIRAPSQAAPVGREVGMSVDLDADEAIVYRADGAAKQVPVQRITAPARPEEVAISNSETELDRTALVVVSRSADDLDARTAQIVLAETLRLRDGRAVLVVDDDADRDTVITLVLAGRADGVLVSLERAAALVSHAAPTAETVR